MGRGAASLVAGPLACRSSCLDNGDAQHVYTRPGSGWFEGLKGR